MIIAAIQHVLRDSDQADAEALASAAVDAANKGAAVIIFPPVPVLSNVSGDDPVAGIFSAIGQEQDENIAYINPSLAPEGIHIATLPVLGRTVLLIGDAALDYEGILTASGKKPNVAIMVPRAENDLQAEAIVELALGLSSSLAGLVVVVDTAGAEPGEPGHGGSTIIHLGEIVAETMGENDETLTAEFELPVPQPEPRELLPKVPSILVARVAHHLGQKPAVDYPADLK